MTIFDRNRPSLSKFGLARAHRCCRSSLPRCVRSRTAMRCCTAATRRSATSNSAACTQLKGTQRRLDRPGPPQLLLQRHRRSLRQQGSTWRDRGVAHDGGQARQGRRARHLLGRPRARAGDDQRGHERHEVSRERSAVATASTANAQAAGGDRSAGRDRSRSTRRPMSRFRRYGDVGRGSAARLHCIEAAVRPRAGAAGTALYSRASATRWISACSAVAESARIVRSIEERRPSCSSAWCGSPM